MLLTSFVVVGLEFNSVVVDVPKMSVVVNVEFVAGDAGRGRAVYAPVSGNFVEIEVPLVRVVVVGYIDAGEGEQTVIVVVIIV